MRNASPLRYPGGKWRLAEFFEGVIRLSGLDRPEYVEAYAGGSSLGLSLLFAERVSEIHLNDLDSAVHSFWRSVLTRSRDFIELFIGTPVTPDEWLNQREVYRKGISAGELALGFAFFYLNRTNHSGILNGGMIGGRNQQGDWKLDARFNRAELLRRLKRIAAYKTRIHLSCEDATALLQKKIGSKKCLVYLDPPYYRPGRHLYLNDYGPEDHLAVRQCVGRLRCPWIVSYDDVAPVRALYKGFRSRKIRLLYTARSARTGSEVLYFSPNLSLPRRLR